MSQVVFVVDDDPDIRDVLSDVLSLQGYEVLAAADGAEALERLREQKERCCLILLDLMMPGMNGWEFRKKQSEDPALRSIPVLLLTGARGAAKAGEDLNAVGVLEKPVTAEDLFAAVARHCGSCRSS